MHPVWGAWDEHSWGPFYASDEHSSGEPMHPTKQAKVGRIGNFCPHAPSMHPIKHTLSSSRTHISKITYPIPPTYHHKGGFGDSLRTFIIYKHSVGMHSIHSCLDQFCIVSFMQWYQIWITLDELNFPSVKSLYLKAFLKKSLLILFLWADTWFRQWLAVSSPHRSHYSCCREESIQEGNPLCPSW